MRTVLIGVTMLGVLAVFAGCLRSDQFRERTGEQLCAWVYDCSMGSVIAPLEETYEFGDVEECNEWFFGRGHHDFDGEWVVAQCEEEYECDFDSDAGYDFLDRLETMDCDDLDVRSFVELAEGAFGEPYLECWDLGGAS